MLLSGMVLINPNLGFEVPISNWERERGRFRESTEGARGAVWSSAGAQHVGA